MPSPKVERLDLATLRQVKALTKKNAAAQAEIVKTIKRIESLVTDVAELVELVELVAPPPLPPPTRLRKLEAEGNDG